MNWPCSRGALVLRRETTTTRIRVTPVIRSRPAAHALCGQLCFPLRPVLPRVSSRLIVCGRGHGLISLACRLRDRRLRVYQGTMPVNTSPLLQPQWGPLFIVYPLSVAFFWSAYLVGLEPLCRWLLPGQYGSFNQFNQKSLQRPTFHFTAIYLWYSLVEILSVQHTAAEYFKH